MLRHLLTYLAKIPAERMVGIVTVQDYGLRCAWQKHMKDIEANPELLSFDIHRPSNLSQPDSNFNTDDLDNFHDQWSDKESCIQYLQNILEKNLESGRCGRCGRNGQYLFLPLNKLLLLRKPIIKRAFEEIFRGDGVSIDEMVNEIGHDESEHSRLMILATLIYTDGIESFNSFIGNKIHDTDLPLKRCRSQLPGTKISFHKNGDAENSLAMNYLSGRHGIRDFDHFCFGQYRHLIPFFDMSPGPVRFYKFDDPKIRLPFTEWYEPKFGGYGSVRRVRIHPAHHNYDALDEKSEFAVKEISANFKWYRDEIRALERFSGQRSGHDHLIRLLMTLQHDDRYYLVFPLARGNLVDLWQQKQMSPTTPQHVEWVLSQCLGITEGLWKIHHYSSWNDDQVRIDEQLLVHDNRNRGRHGDIKPENILFFSTPNGNYRLVITDFGLTRFHSAFSISNVAADRVGGFSRTYRPPEFDLNSPISQAYDMWSLGCVFLEFISWLLIGYSSTRPTFNRARLQDDAPSHNVVEDKFFNIHGRVPTVKPSVNEWIHKLRTNGTCPSAMKDFLDIIENGLLQPNPQDRWKIEMFHGHLKGICDDYKKAPNETWGNDANSTLAVFDEKYRVVGHLRMPHKGPLRQTQDQRRIELQRKILDQANRRRGIRNMTYGNLNDAMQTVEENTSTSPTEESQETELARKDITKTSGQLAQEGLENRAIKFDSATQLNPVHLDIKPSPFQSVRKAFQDGYARFKRISKRLACIGVN
ncbi:kinase-like protein [Hypoxylon trugodes]|uniref:kinase-like protein n=1 Tax=Hypoxylon trugodes TaxID=326681 RepID=UPI00218E4B04|nr:kinase-like protein [Hypoxylon trugodes]KAI1389264.1 kinase-like protein [Hypoxylon trugodes]